MKSQKSKALETQVVPDVGTPLSEIFQNNRKKKPELTKKELRLLSEEKVRKRVALFAKIKKGIGKFFTILFIVAVIVSMVLVPLLIVFG